MYLIPRSGRSLGVGTGNPLQYSCLENSMDRGAWRATVHGVAKSQTWPSTHTYFNKIKKILNIFLISSLDFLNLGTIDFLVKINCLLGELSCILQDGNCILHLYLLDVSSTQLWQPEMSPDITRCPLGAKIDHGWESLI